MNITANAVGVRYARLRARLVLHIVKKGTATAVPFMFVKFNIVRI